MIPLRTQAIQKLAKAAKLLSQAGCINEMTDLAVKESELVRGNAGFYEDDENVEFFDCAVCQGKHYLTLHVKKPKFYSHQYAIEISLSYHWDPVGFWCRLRQACRSFWTILHGEVEQHEVLIEAKDVNRLKDVFRTMIREEEKKASS